MKICNSVFHMWNIILHVCNVQKSPVDTEKCWHLGDFPRIRGKNLNLFWDFCHQSILFFVHFINYFFNGDSQLYLFIHSCLLRTLLWSLCVYAMFLTWFNGKSLFSHVKCKKNVCLHVNLSAWNVWKPHLDKFEIFKLFFFYFL